MQRLGWPPCSIKTGYPDFWTHQVYDEHNKRCWVGVEWHRQILLRHVKAAGDWKMPFETKQGMNISDYQLIWEYLGYDSLEAFSVLLKQRSSSKAPTSAAGSRICLKQFPAKLHWIVTIQAANFEPRAQHHGIALPQSDCAILHYIETETQIHGPD